MKSFAQRIKRLFYTRIFVLFNLSAVAFTFQACYGSPQDGWMDVGISGYVLATDTREPIQGIKVDVLSSGLSSYTDEEGFFVVRTESDSAYTIVFSDVDGDDNGLYWDKTTVLTDTVNSYDLSLKVMLNPKKD